MVELTLASWPFPAFRSSVFHGVWKVGEVRQLPEEAAEYLLRTFPDNVKRTSGFDASGLLAGSARSIVAALDGLTGDDLRAALAAEEAGKNRKTVTGAIRAALEA